MTIPRKSDHVTIMHGYALQDPYHWMREKDTDEVLSFLHAENDYVNETLSDTTALQEELYQEMKGRIKEADTSASEIIDQFEYYYRTEANKQYRIYCRKPLGGNEEQIILDANALAEGHPYFVLGTLRVSPNHRFLAYTIDLNGSEHFTVHVKDLETGSVLHDSLQEADTAIEWYADSATFLYMILDETRRAYKIAKHVLGQSQSEDVILLHEPDEAFFLGIDKSRDGKHLFIESASKTTSECWIFSAEVTSSTPRSIAGRQHGHEYHVTSHGHTLFVLSNRAGVNFSLSTAQVDLPHEWNEILPHRDDTKLEWIVSYSDRLVIGERTGGLEHVHIHCFNGEDHMVSFPDPVYDITPGKNPMNDTNTFRFYYSSPICPPTVYDYDLQTRKLTIVKQDEIPGGFQPNDYIVERHFAIANDGIHVPLTIVRKKDIQLDGSAPAFMVGYGSYGFPMPTAFSSSLVSLLNRGFVCARAHIRGGSDMGEQWYLDGKLQKKINTFSDFIACAEYLISNGFTSKERLSVQGGSAGGLLMGAIANMRPDLFHTIIASVPFVDLMNTMLDASLPLTVAEYEEWGNPNVREDFEYMLSYSPYDNIAHQDYPHILAIAGYHDQRVSYWEPAKWIAKLRDHNTGNSTILLYTKFTAGHFGASGRFDYLKELALEYAFILKYSNKND